MLAHVLKQVTARPYMGLVDNTKGNLNGNYGVRLSILRKPDYPYNWVTRLPFFLLLPLYSLKQAFFSKYPRVLVLEYGTYDAGHIQDLVKFATPKIAILTNIGPAHLKRHKTVEGVYMEKRALVQGAPSNGLVVLGSGHEFVQKLQEDAKAPVKIVNGRGITLAENITRVVCSHLGLPKEITEQGLKSFEPPKSRLSSFKKAGIEVIDDSYNANPLSMKLGLDTLADRKTAGIRTVGLLGGMAELGDLASQYHKEIGLYAKERADFVVGVGKGTQDYAPDRWFASSAECAENIFSILKSGDVVLIKGSNSSKMKLIVQALKSAPPPPSILSYQQDLANKRVAE